LKLLALIGIAMPVFAQYGGPAILSRGEAPSAMMGPQLAFRPFVEVNGVYSTGLSGVTVDSSGNIANRHGAGVNVTAGLSGSHGWRHTTVGMSFRGGYSTYFGHSGYNSTDISMNLGVAHQVSRHISLTWNNSMGIFNRDAGLLASISPAVPFDPNQTYVPTTDFFNNRTIFYSSQLGMVIQKSTRLSFSLNGGIFENHRASDALYGVLGENATADMQYRLTKRATIGAAYSYSHYGYSRIASNTNGQGAAATFAYQLSHWWEFSGLFGFTRVETKFIQNVPVDPAIAAIIGISQSSQIVYSVRYIPNVSARLSRTFHKGVLFFAAGYGMTPGNGLFLTSESLTANVGYTYTGLRRWSFGALASYQDAHSIGNVYGSYGGETASIHASRQFFRTIHMVAAVDGHRYSSGNFSKYNQTVYTASLGLGWSPGDVPLRIW
jgi:hypothetical protein